MNKLILVSIGLIMSLATDAGQHSAVHQHRSRPIKNVTTGYSTNFMEQTTWLLGYFSRDRMAIPPHSGMVLKGMTAISLIRHSAADFRISTGMKLR